MTLATRTTPSCETQSAESTKQSVTAVGDDSDQTRHLQIAPPSAIRTSATSTFYAVKGPNGDLTWRVESPAHAVGAKVQYIPDDKGAEVLFWPNESESLPWYMEVVMEDGSERTFRSRKSWEKFTKVSRRIRSADAFYPAQEGSACVWTRPLAWQARHMMEMRNKHGIRVLAEVDDNYLSDKRLNVFLQKAGWGANDRDNHSRSICVGDGIIVSTEYLRDVYWEQLSDLFGKKILPEIFVCRNFIDDRFIPTPIPRDGRLRIGYMGSDSHFWDIDLIYPALKEAYDLGHEIVFIGINPTQSISRHTVNDVRDKARWLDIEFTHIPWNNDKYRGVALPLDIGLAPLRVDKHTLGKSDIKWLEYGLSGAATVAQNCLVYNRSAVHGEHALMAGSPREFRDRMVELIKSESLRQRLVTNTQQYINEERLLSKHAGEWKDAVLG